MKDKYIEENKVSIEIDLLEELLSLNSKEILELGCGTSKLTRKIALNGSDRKIIATEVDTVQLAKNLLIEDLPNVQFINGGAEKIDFSDNSFDIVLLFKSLHHVPVKEMGEALSEINRVLRSGGLLYISEPVFAGDYNEILRLFHDEEFVRAEAYRYIKSSVESQAYSQVHEIFFNTEVIYNDFNEFKEQVIGVSHQSHILSEELWVQVENKFLKYHAENLGRFLIPHRINLLQKPQIHHNL